MQNRPGGSTLPTLSTQTASDTVAGGRGPGAGTEDIDGHEPTVTALKLVPISPESFQRYTRRRTIAQRDTEYVVPPLSRSFSRGFLRPYWKAERHPEGGLYFFHEQQRVFTDAYLYETAASDQILSVVDQLLARAELQDLLASNSGHIDIVVDLMKESSENDECGYYLVDHSARIIFWLDPFKMSTLESWKQVPGIDAPSHVKMCLEVEYWRHCTYFPAAMVFSLETMDELRDTIIFGIGDAMTSSTTTQSLPVEHLFRMLTLAKEMRSGSPETGDTTRMNDGSAAIVARFMQDFALARFYNFHGEKTPRLNNDESVYGSESIPKRSRTLECVSLLLFNSPLRYLETLQVVNMDQLINYSSWQKFITVLRSEWLDLVLYGTLILNTNVGFLSIPASGASAAGQLASYISICLGLTAIILGILFLRTYQVGPPDVTDAATAVALFHYHGRSAHGLEVLSVALSLPFTLTIWALIAFVVAFLITVFATGSVEVRAIMFATVLTASLAIISFIWTEKRFVWAETMAETKMKIKHAGSLVWNSVWLSRSSSRKRPKGPRDQTTIYP